MIEFSTFVCAGGLALIAVLLGVKAVRIARKDAAQCARCGYPTPFGRDPESVRCPECGDHQIVHPFNVAFRRRPALAALLCALLAISTLVLDRFQLSPWRLALRAMPDTLVIRLAGAQRDRSAAEDEFRRRRTWAELSDPHALDAWLDDAAWWGVDAFFVVQRDGTTLLGKLWVVPPWGGRTPTDYHVFVRASDGTIVATRPLTEDLQGRSTDAFAAPEPPWVPLPPSVAIGDPVTLELQDNNGKVLWSRPWVLRLAKSG